jgi:hypothetical protein
VAPSCSLGPRSPQDAAGGDQLGRGTRPRVPGPKVVSASAAAGPSAARGGGGGGQSSTACASGSTIPAGAGEASTRRDLPRAGAGKRRLGLARESEICYGTSGGVRSSECWRCISQRLFFFYLSQLSHKLSCVFLKNTHTHTTKEEQTLPRNTSLVTNGTIFSSLQPSRL